MQSDLLWCVHTGQGGFLQHLVIVAALLAANHSAFKANGYWCEITSHCAGQLLGCCQSQPSTEGVPADFEHAVHAYYI